MWKNHLFRCQFAPNTVSVNILFKASIHQKLQLILTNTLFSESCININPIYLLNVFGKYNPSFMDTKPMAWLLFSVLFVPLPHKSGL